MTGKDNLDQWPVSYLEKDFFLATEYSKTILSELSLSSFANVDNKATNRSSIYTGSHMPVIVFMTKKESPDDITKTKINNEDSTLRYAALNSLTLMPIWYCSMKCNVHWMTLHSTIQNGMAELFSSKKNSRLLTGIRKKWSYFSLNQLQGLLQDPDFINLHMPYICVNAGSMLKYLSL